MDFRKVYYVKALKTQRSNMNIDLQMMRLSELIDFSKVTFSRFINLILLLLNSKIKCT